MKKYNTGLTLDEFKLNAQQHGLRIPDDRSRELYEGLMLVKACAQRVREALDSPDELTHFFRIRKV
jgi:hypothetical protein